MKRKLALLCSATFIALFSLVESNAQVQIKGPSSSATPYLLGVAPTATITSILSVPDVIGTYPMVGIPDGLGAYANEDGTTFTLLMNHELGNTIGISRAHGGKGAFVSKWVINKSDLSVMSGADLMQNVYLWNTTTSGYELYNATSTAGMATTVTSPLLNFGRFCSADLPALSAFYNSVSGLGTMERIFMNGEEGNGTNSRAMAHIVTGSLAGSSFELPLFGKADWENVVATPFVGDKTIIVVPNDGSILDSKVYIYVGTKTNSGSPVEMAGLTNGKLYAVSVSGFSTERISGTVSTPVPTPDTRFSLIDLGDVSSLSGAYLNSWVNTLGGTKFARPEDGAWDPSSPNDFYFNTTDQLDQVTDGVGTQVGRSKVWRLRFDDMANPEDAGTITAVLDGTEGHVMFDNMAIDNNGHIMLLEDVGGNAHNGKIWQYSINEDKLALVAKHDPARFGDIGIAAKAPFNNDEEASGIIDMSEILGANKFLFVDQAHYSITTPGIAEGGQLLLLELQSPIAQVTTFNDFSLTITGGVASSTPFVPNLLISTSNGPKSFTVNGSAAALKTIAGNSLALNLVPSKGGVITITGNVGTATGFTLQSKPAIVSVYAEATITEFLPTSFLQSGNSIDVAPFFKTNSPAAKTFSITGSSASLTGSTVTGLSVGRVTVTGSVAPEPYYFWLSNNTRSAVINVYGINPTITFNGFNLTVGGVVDLASYVSSNSAGEKSFTIVGGDAASISGTSFTALSGGSVTVLASIAANGNFNAISTSATIEVLTVTSPIVPVNPTIAFSGFATTVGGSVNLASVLVTNSTGAKSFSVAGEAVTLVGTTLSAVKLGTATITGTVASTTGFNSVGASVVVTVVSSIQLATSSFETVSFELYPNPVVDGELYFTSAITGSIFNATGTEVSSFINASKINVSGLTKGIYLVKTTGYGFKKFVIE